MTQGSVTVTCTVCDFERTYDRLSEARIALAIHETETEHVTDWRIDRLSPGVERAGDDAGVCGRPECAATGSPLVRRSERERTRSK